MKEQKEIQEILFQEEKEKVKNTKKDLKRKKQLEKIAKASDTTLKHHSDKLNKTSDVTDLTKTQKFMNFTSDIKTSVLDNIEDNINSTKEKTKYGIGNILVNGILIIASLTFFIYSILFTTIQTNQLYLLIGGLIILSMIAIFCISIVCGKILYRVLSIFNYLVFIGYVIFNLLIVIGI